MVELVRDTVQIYRVYSHTPPTLELGEIDPFEYGLLILVILAIVVPVVLELNPQLRDSLYALINPKPPIEKIVEIALDEINRERVKHGIPPLKLLNLSIAQFRAEDMVENRYYGHCDPKGRPPVYWYTLLGGMYYVEENIGAAQYMDEEEFVKQVIHDMIYNDLASLNLHRDSLLDPTNNYVDIGFAEKNGYMTLVIHMQKVWVKWIEKPSYDEKTGLFHAKGILLLNNSRIESVAIYRADRDTSRYPCTFLREVYCTCSFYDIGEMVAGVVPHPDMFYPGAETVIARKWYTDGRLFEIEFTWKPHEPGIYTIVIWATNTLKMEHPYDATRYSKYIPILGYTFEVGNQSQ